MSIRLHCSKLESLFIESMAPQRSNEEEELFKDKDESDDFPESIEKPDVRSIITDTHFAPNIYMVTKAIRLPEPYHSIDGNLHITDDYLHGAFAIYPQIPAALMADKEKKAQFIQEFHRQFVALNGPHADEKYEDALFFNVQNRPTYVIDFNHGNNYTEFHFGEVGAEPLSFSTFGDFKEALDTTVLKLEKILNVGREIMVPLVDKKPVIRSILYHSDY